LVAVVGLAKVISPSIETGLHALGAPPAMLAILIALVVLLPESISAARAATVNRLQTSINLALGSALASIGLTIPVVITVSVLFDLPLKLGLESKDIVLLTLTLMISGITLSSARTTIMQGALHLALFATFLFLTLFP
jgi:Ca2+:H+ antiporter